MTDEDDLFAQAMGDVKRLDVPNRVLLDKRDKADAAAKLRRQAAEAIVDSPSDNLSGDFVSPVGPHDVLEFKRPGIQNGVYKNLRLGKYAIDARLDLHRMKVDDARLAVAEFIKDCVTHDIRCALITHGKGENRQPQPALLKSCIAHWLPQLEVVMAFHSAQRHHGGLGAVYVLFRKSEKARLENWERHQKR